MRRKNRGKQTLKKKMLSILLLSAMSSILAVVIVSYMTIRMIQNDGIKESMQIYIWSRLHERWTVITMT